VSLGTRLTGSIVDAAFNSRFQNVLTSLVGGAVAVYKDNGTVESTAGVTLLTDFDGKVGVNLVRIDTSVDTTFYAAGSTFTIILTAGTVAGFAAAGVIVDDFTLSALQPTPQVSTAVGVIVAPTPGQVTFESVWRMVLGHCPIAGAGLAREWTQWAYDEFCSARRSWSHLRVQSGLAITASRSGTCGVTQNAATVTSSGLVFTSADVGRTFRVATSPYYTILSVTSGTATLDRTYLEATDAAALGVIFDGYVTLPADFGRFLAVIDPSMRWRVRFDVSSDWLNRLDPMRQSAVGSPRLLANATFSPVAATLGQPRFEWYQVSTTARTFPMWYLRKAEIMADDTALIGPLSDRKDILIEGALSRAALWPGLENRKNSYFNLQLAKVHEEKFREKISQAYVADEELYWEGLPVAEMGYAQFPFDSAWMQQHDLPAMGDLVGWY
jgi:hypothetical protein